MHTLRLWVLLITASTLLTAFAGMHTGDGFGFSLGSIHLCDTGGGGPGNPNGNG